MKFLILIACIAVASASHHGFGGANKYTRYSPESIRERDYIRGEEYSPLNSIVGLDTIRGRDFTPRTSIFGLESPRDRTYIQREEYSPLNKIVDLDTIRAREFSPRTYVQRAEEQLYPRTSIYGGETPRERAYIQREEHASLYPRTSIYGSESPRDRTYVRAEEYSPLYSIMGLDTIRGREFSPKMSLINRDPLVSMLNKEYIRRADSFRNVDLENLDYLKGTKDFASIKKDFVVFYAKYLMTILDIIKSRFGDVLARVDTVDIDTTSLPIRCTKLNGLMRWIMLTNVDVTKYDPRVFDYYMMCKTFDYVVFMRNYFLHFDIPVMYKDLGLMREFYGMVGDQSYGINKYYNTVFGRDLNNYKRQMTTLDTSYLL